MIKWPDRPRGDSACRSTRCQLATLKRRQRYSPDVVWCDVRLLEWNFPPPPAGRAAARDPPAHQTPRANPTSFIVTADAGSAGFGATPEPAGMRPVTGVWGPLPPTLPSHSPAWPEDVDRAQHRMEAPISHNTQSQHSHITVTASGCTHQLASDRHGARCRVQPLVARRVRGRSSEVCTN